MRLALREVDEIFVMSCISNCNFLCRLWLQTVNSLQHGSTIASTSPEYTHEALSIDPLSVLRCDVRVFRLICHVSIFLGQSRILIYSFLFVF